MKYLRKNEHDEEVIKQFTKQAIPFTKVTGHLNSIELLIEMSGATADDNILDIACGPGLVACEFAKVARHVTGIDLTEKMIEQALCHQKEKGLNNLSWDIGTVYQLPYDSDTFSVVVSRYSFHHLLNPDMALAEMLRVCMPGGVIVIADVALPADKSEAFNRMERLRDPSHTEALSYDKWKQLLFNSGLKKIRRGSYKVPMELETQLNASFPNPGDDKKIRDIFLQDIDANCLGVESHKCGDEVHFSYPISVYVGEK
ncbi:class I SAM-dependent methyltransferase [Pseudoalteromonas sp. J010]|uniref:class I SAM-dependent methyltransferase n=1 Tax=Pseudoalteromonas sp. J010 TaxID=998465 RepID=UPI000F64AD75|nr:class I SAM-dependent methyltransferase [Pseudoalteromonas sp. J010]RRS07876.1 class I SAM-dependent methyltransferase [Pseudoalteromonas sp. J010]